MAPVDSTAGSRQDLTPQARASSRAARPAQAPRPRTLGDVVHRRRTTATEPLAQCIQREIDKAPPLTPEQRRRALACDELRRVISWADPTGETAVHNVMRAGGGR